MIFDTGYEIDLYIHLSYFPYKSVVFQNRNLRLKIEIALNEHVILCFTFLILYKPSVEEKKK